MPSKTTKIAAGAYKVTDGTRTVDVTRVTYPNDGTYWIAAAQWDYRRLSDPLWTKREAVTVAKHMLQTAVDF